MEEMEQGQLEMALRATTRRQNPEYAQSAFLCFTWGRDRETIKCGGSLTRLGWASHIMYSCCIACAWCLS